MRKVALNLINTSKKDDDESPERRGFNDSRFVPFLGFFSQGCFLEIRLAVWNVTDVFKYLKRRELFEQRVFSYTKLFTTRRIFKQTFIHFIPPCLFFPLSLRVLRKTRKIPNYSYFRIPYLPLHRRKGKEEEKKKK